MSIKIVAVLALALIGTVAVYHFSHHGGQNNNNQKNQTQNETSGNQSHYYPNYVMMFNGYKAKNGLKFGAAEDGKRLDVFIQNAKIVQAHNSKESSYKLGLTSLAHLTREEFAALKLGYKGPSKVNSDEPVEVTETDDNDDEVDWTKKGGVTPVKNQGQCGSCWAFSTVGALEGLHFTKTGKLVSLSEQNLVDCSTSYGNNGCNGGLMDYGFKYVEENGIATEEAYPYTGTDGECKKFEPVFKNAGYADVKKNSAVELKKALKNGPVSVAIEADTSAFQLYKSGVLTGDACGTQLDHGVLAVGYGHEGKDAYFKVKNSWGPSWGDRGYVLIGSAKDAGVCGINSAASYPTA